jgi:hypothetical protein
MRCGVMRMITGFHEPASRSAWAVAYGLHTMTRGAFQHDTPTESTRRTAAPAVGGQHGGRIAHMDDPLPFLRLRDFCVGGGRHSLEGEGQSLDTRSAEKLAGQNFTAKTRRMSKADQVLLSARCP